MASIIRVKRSTGTLAPPSLQFGELGLTVGVGTYANRGGRLFAGDNASNSQIVGGRYYTDLLSIEPGKVAGQDNPTTVSNGFVPILLTELSGNPGGTGNITRLPRVDQWSVDNITLDGNTIYSNDTNGDIKFVTNGSGEVNIDDDTFLSFGVDKDSKIEYDENGTDKIQVTGADWNFADGVAIKISDTTSSTDTTTGALVVSGGVGIGGSLNIGGSVSIGTQDALANFTVSGDLTVQGGNVGLAYTPTTIDIKDNVDGSLSIKEGTNEYLKITTTDNQEKVSIGTAIASVDIEVEDNVADAFVIRQSSNKYIEIDTLNSSELLTISTANVDIDRNLNIDGRNLTTNENTFNIINTNATTVSAFGQASILGIGSTAAVLTLRPSTVVGTNATQTLYNTVATTVSAFGEATTIGIGSTAAVLTLRPSTVVGTNATQTLYNTVATTVSAFGEATTIGIGSTASTLTLRPSTVVGTNATQTLYNTVATTVNAFGQATTIGIGSTAAILTLRPSTVVGTNATQTLYNTVATTVNAFGEATTLSIGATASTLTLRPSTVVGTSSTQDLYNAVATTVNAFGAATNLVVGATTGVATIRNATVSIPNATTLTLGSSTSPTTVSFASTTNTSFVSIASTANATSTTTGALRVAGGVGITSNLYVGGELNVAGVSIGGNGDISVTGNLSVNGNSTLGNSSNDLTVITGIVTHTGPFTNIGGVTIDNVGISSNIISTKSGGGNTLYIDPYPDGLSNEGTVVIKGDLQVDGTTTTVNSSVVSVNDAIISLGDVTSARTVMTAVGTGVSTIVLDSIVGINTGDLISGSASLPGAGTTTIHSYNSGLKTVYINGVTSAGIAATTQLTVTHAYDTNTDRGISFNYNTGTGIANTKLGFFGFNDSIGENSSAPAGAWTYIPDATISNSVASGIKGYLDIKGIYYQSGDFSNNGIVYFDVNGLQTSTVSPGSGISTSNYVLTTNASGTPTWTDTLDGGTF